MIVQDLFGKERMAFVATDPYLCWICGDTIRAGQQYTRHHLQAVKTITYPVCRSCFQFRQVDPITDKVTAILPMIHELPRSYVTRPIPAFETVKLPEVRRWEDGETMILPTLPRTPAARAKPRIPFLRRLLQMFVFGGWI